jgi:hypothetical protein
VSRLRRRRGLIAAGLAVVALGALALIVPPAVTPDGPQGTSILRRFLRVRGIEVAEGDRPGAGVFFLPHDLRTRRQAEPLLDWVRAGGTAVVADPTSAVLAGAGIRPAPTTAGGLVPEQRAAADCALPAAVGVRAIVIGSTDAVFSPARRSIGCFHREAGAFLVQRRVGEGTMVGLGGLTPLTNALLEDEDDVVLAWNLLGREGSVVFGSPVPAGASEPRGLWDLLPAPAKVIVVQAVLAAAVFAIARGRRLGRRPEEDAPLPIPATELVTATGELYRRGRVARHAASVLRRAFLDRAVRRLGVSPDAQDVVGALASAAALSEDEVARALGPAEVSSERDLVAAARGVERLERRMEGDRT